MAKSAFIANISHELRTPMNALLGMAQLLERAELPKQQADHVKVMLEAGRGLQTLLDDVIALTRDDDEQLEDEDCDPVQTARAVARLLQPRAWEKRLRLTLTARPTCRASPPIRAGCARSLLKLADNALKFTERGLVDIRVESETRRATGVVRFTVSDTGQGVAPELAAQAVQAFLARRCLLCPQAAGRGAGPGGGQAHRRTGGRRDRLRKRCRAKARNSGSPCRSRARRGGDSAERAGEGPAPRSSSCWSSRRGRGADRQSAGAVRQPRGDRPGVADAATRARRENFDPIIVAAPECRHAGRGTRLQSTPPACGREGGERARQPAPNALLRWPGWPALRNPTLAIYAVLDLGTTVSRKPRAEPPPSGSCRPPSILRRSQSLEKLSVAAKPMVEILKSYIDSALSTLPGARRSQQRCQLAGSNPAAQDIAGSAGALGLAAITEAARGFASAARAGVGPHDCATARRRSCGNTTRSAARWKASIPTWRRSGPRFPSRCVRARLPYVRKRNHPRDVWRLPALTPAPGGAALCARDGACRRVDIEEARRIFRSGDVLVAHTAFVSGRLKAPPVSALFDVLELFAFVHPAQPCVPSALGLARALGLAWPSTREDAARTLHEAADRLIEKIAALPKPGACRCAS